MISDSCCCSNTNVQNCKTISRLTPIAWCPICDRTKSRRRCQSEGLHQESDPLKELNRCCDKGCEHIYYSSHHSQSKKTDLQSGDKKLICSDDVEMDISDLYNGIKKHHSKPHREKCFLIQKNGQFYNLQEKINNSFPLMYENTKKASIGLYQQNRDINLERNISNSKHDKIRNILSKYHCTDNPNIELPSQKASSFSEQDKCSSEMRERYIKEMEILRSKLNLLKGEMVCDGKRLRQRSESEPGFAGINGGVPKRARDNSPKMKYINRKLPANLPLCQAYNKILKKQNLNKPEINYELPLSKPSSPKKTNYSINGTSLNIQSELQDKSNNESSESDLEESICDDELLIQEGEANISEDDDHSILSSISASTDSNTPSQVGETLQSITLNETPKNEATIYQSKCQTVKVSLPKLVPMYESDYLENNQDGTKCSSPFRISLFSNVPPYVKFFMHDFKGSTLPTDITRHLKWKLSSITPIVIRRTLINSGFRLVRKSNDWTGQWGKHMKSFVFKTLKDFQKLNHFPGTFQIGRKDRLWKNLYRLMVKFGKKEFGFIPKTFILPQDSKLLRTAWEKASGLGKGQWIVKPPAAARGTGIKVVHKWGQIPKKRPLIVQKYIAKPYLINGSKFDLRLYVLMTSIHPLRIYLYDDGLVRFASVKYSDGVEFLSDRFMHLTNYSINKLSNQYCANEDASSCRGHKWTLKALWTYLTKQGVNVKLLRKNLIDLVIKTIISGESNINILSKNNLPSRYCSYELFGIDVLLDQTLKPWLLEVNISPSLHSASPLDLAVKGPLVRELLNIAGFQIPGKLAEDLEENFLETYGLKDRIHSLCYDKRIYCTALSKEERLKQETHNTMTREEYLNSILEDLTPDDVRHLIQFEDELTQLGRFEKVFPTSRTYTYHQYFESPRYYNMMLDAWETKYHKNRAEGIKVLESLCQQKLHLIVPATGSIIKISLSQSQSEISNQAIQKGEVETEESEVEKEVEPHIKTEKELKQVAFCTTATDSKRNTSLNSGMSSTVNNPAIHISFSSGREIESQLSPRSLDNEEMNNEINESKNEMHHTNTCFKMLTEMQHASLKYLPESKVDLLKQYPSCKLENSIINETLNNGKNIISSPKHIHSTCIKMNMSN